MTPEEAGLLLDLRAALAMEDQSRGHLAQFDGRLITRANAAIRAMREEKGILENEERRALLDSFTCVRDDILTRREVKLFYLAQDNDLPKPGTATPQEALFCSQIASKLRDFRQVVRT